MGGALRRGRATSQDDNNGRDNWGSWYETPRPGVSAGSWCCALALGAVLEAGRVIIFAALPPFVVKARGTCKGSTTKSPHERWFT